MAAIVGGGATNDWYNGMNRNTVYKGETNLAEVGVEFFWYIWSFWYGMYLVVLAFGDIIYGLKEDQYKLMPNV